MEIAGARLEGKFFKVFQKNLVKRGLFSHNMSAVNPSPDWLVLEIQFLRDTGAASRDRSRSCPTDTPVDRAALSPNLKK
jgi:hypothetical protein